MVGRQEECRGQATQITGLVSLFEEQEEEGLFLQQLRLIEWTI